MSDLHRQLKTGTAKLVNCRQCGKEMLGAAHAADVTLLIRCGRNIQDLPPLVAGRINGVPYCSECLALQKPVSVASVLTPRQAIKLGDTSS